MSSASPVQTPSRTRFPIELFRRLRFGPGLFCPRCGGVSVQHWGRFGWRRRYRCRDCERTFSDFTGTPLAYLKRVDRWRPFCRIFHQAHTVRHTARLLGIHPSTAFRWRRRLLAGLRRTEIPRLGGRVSVGETWFPFSRKGSRSLDRPPRKRRFEGLSSETDPVWVVLAADTRGALAGATAGATRPELPILRDVLGGCFEPNSVVLSRAGKYGGPARLAREEGLGWEQERGILPERRSDGDPEPAPLLAWRLKRWLRRFRGVATRYLDEYLVWFRLIDLVRGRTIPPRPLEGVLIGAFP